jgi:hypothetical protein
MMFFEKLACFFLSSMNAAVQLMDEHRLDADETGFSNGVHREKEYIAWQTPSADTAPVFWEMIIQYQVSRIVMLDHRQYQPPSSVKFRFDQQENEFYRLSLEQDGNLFIHSSG